MNETKFTPGPWFVDECWCVLTTIAAVSGPNLLSVNSPKPTMTQGKTLAVVEQDANARLIAKSPEMFALLLDLIEIQSASCEAILSGAGVNDVILAGKGLGRVIEKAEKIVSYITSDSLT